MMSDGRQSPRGRDILKFLEAELQVGRLSKFKKFCRPWAEPRTTGGDIVLFGRRHTACQLRGKHRHPGRHGRCNLFRGTTGEVALAGLVALTVRVQVAPPWGCSSGRSSRKALPKLREEIWALGEGLRSRLGCPSVAKFKLQEPSL
jgi:hypothetical protein